MKKLNKLTAVLLSLALCLGMVAPAFAASFDDLQDAISGVEAPATPETPDTPSTPDTPVDIPQNGTQIKDEADGTLGYGWNGDENSESKGWDIWAKENDDGGRDIELKGDVTHEETDKTDTIIVDDKVNIDLNDHNITGNGEDTVIKVEEGGDLTITGGESDAEGTNTISNNPSNAETPAEGANGIDVEGKLELDGVTITDTDTAVNVEKGGEAEIENSTITGNNTGVAFVDDSSVTFVEDQNVVNGNITNISGTGKVDFKLGDTTYKVDAETAETLLADKGSIAANGKDWILAKNDDGAYTVVYTGTGGKYEGTDNWLSEGIVKSILDDGKLNGKKVSAFIVSDAIKTIGYNAFAHRKDIKEVQLKNGLTTIQKSAFSGCSGLERINIPATVTMINDSAFTGCANLKKIELPSGLTTLGHSVFQNCTQLAGTVTIPAGVTTIMQYTFKGCTNLERIAFAEGSKCTEIKNEAFCQCTGLKGSVVIPERVTSIGNQAFKNCTSLEAVQINGDIKTIDVGTFSGCSSLKTVNIPETVETIGRSAFDGCKELTKIELPEGLKVLGDTAFKNCINLTGVVTIPAGLEKIDSAVFYGCKLLDGVEFADNSKCVSIGRAAFYNCEGIKNLVIPGSVKTIGTQAFYLCRGLETVELKEGVNKLDSLSFSGCPKMTSINIPQTVTSIGNKAFYMSRTLKTITIPAGVTEFGTQVFDDVIVDNVVMSVWIPSEEGSEATAKLVASKTDVNIFIKADDENLTFYRGKVSADFGHNIADEDVKLDDGSVALTNVNGTITVDESAVTIPTGAPVSIDTNGNITVNAPITVSGVSYPYGATIAPDGTVTALPAPPVYDDYTDPTEVEVDDPAVPLAAGPVTRAQFVDYLWRHEGEPEGADCTFADVPADHEYVLALGWAEANGIAAADADGNFQPDELVTVEAVRAILGSFTNVFGTNAVAVADLTTLTGDDGEAVLNCDQVLAEFFGEEYILPEDLDILEPDDAA